MEPWIRSMVEDIVNPVVLRPGQKYLHPEDGTITILAGQYYSNGRISNHWSWSVDDTGELKHGYGENWPKVDMNMDI